ncbi:MAG TPA: hypothetical protein PLU72_13350 [Candidatus Ozemobacteraceae bacterium]|nr:hypothetical protein [Candidatus Ozemobacteraceae bacterium]HQG27718.1 hypothetical protein [Candidatus Ozemobacteraceae bacterium]
MGEKETLLELADGFIENELALAGLYEACIDFLPAFRNVWESLKNQEEAHAEVFRQIRRAIDESHQSWSQGRFFIQTLRLMTADVRKLTVEIRARTANPRYVVQHMMDTENSLIESELTKAFITREERFQALLSKLQDETTSHRSSLREILRTI